MARPLPAGQLDRIADAAAAVFARRGYRRTRVADVAREIGVAAGTLYRYAEGKDALVLAAITRGFREPRPDEPSLPLAPPKPDQLEAAVRERLGGADPSPVLGRILRGEAGLDADPRAELEATVREIYDGLARERRALALMERLAQELPPVATAYYERGRARLLRRLEELIARRVAAAQYRPVPDVEAAARLLLEACAWFAWHRHGDAAPPAASDEAARRTITTFALRALLAEETP